MYLFRIGIWSVWKVRWNKAKASIQKNLLLFTSGNFRRHQTSKEHLLKRYLKTGQGETKVLI